MIKTAERIETMAEASAIVVELMIAHLHGSESITVKDMSLAVWGELEANGYRLADTGNGIEIKSPQLAG